MAFSIKHTRQAENTGEKLVFFFSSDVLLIYSYGSWGWDWCCYEQAKERREQWAGKGSEWKYVVINDLAYR